MREDFFLGASFRNLEDLNLQFRVWLDQVANPRTHATTRRVVAEHFAEGCPHLQALPVGPFQAVLQLERRVTRDGMISLHGNLYSVPNATRRRIVEVPRGPRRAAGRAGRQPGGHRRGGRARHGHAGPGLRRPGARPAGSPAWPGT